MRPRDARELLAGSGVASLGSTTWADLGSGDGTFTLALASLLAPGSVIHAMDRDDAALRRIPPAGPQVRIEPHRGDFTKQPWPFDRLDGILMANSLHYVADQASFIRACAPHLQPSHRFLIVEYDMDARDRNDWVPYPLNQARLRTVFATAGYASITILASRPSLYRRAALYAAMIEP
jgi:SAM-dependent methyltransferase